MNAAVELSGDQLVAELISAHQDTQRLSAQLASARQRRREVAAQLHAAGRTYQWIGQQLGVTAQAVEGLVKYKQRRPTARE